MHVRFELVAPAGSLISIGGELMEINVNFVMIRHGSKGEVRCYPWHQIKLLTCDSDPRIFSAQV